MKYPMAAMLAAVSLHAHAQQEEGSAAPSRSAGAAALSMYGSFDGGLRHETHIDAEGNDNTTIGSNGTFRSNRLGFAAARRSPVAPASMSCWS